MGNTYTTYKKEMESLKKRISEIEEECAKNGLSFDEMIIKSLKERQRVYDLDKEMRLIQDPVIQYNKKWKGELIPLNEFISYCGSAFTDYDGYGQYATESSVSDIKIYPSDILEGKYRKDFTHVMWFSK